MSDAVTPDSLLEQMVADRQLSTADAASFRRFRAAAGSTAAATEGDILR